MDTGPVLACAATEIGADETAGELSQRLSVLGASLLRTELPRFLRGELLPRPQEHDKSTLAPMLSKEDGRIAWERPAIDLHNLVRGTLPWPGAYTFIEGQRVKMHRTRVLTEAGAAAAPGTVVRADRHGIEVACGAGVLVIEELQPDGKRRMRAEQFLAGMRLQRGIRFGADAP
jgi:methionyl-tRNA formyltransferase